ncbi:HlyD family efflux transporter periplasmic adaptor subunit [Aureispira sp. CCB-E]|uniref:HlyD family secretion protein n=1 Tax=Aureispira sp. CCB-E TaxID=3051121 RepID=UPI002868D5A5|nr:HlyD family efflux transporter periplasmic adaptor subunit [Aureispira sp. CCB-E]WMX14512.1 HlyD family efflux transporter periplasmic adaptor subunit [Aureispira sp. CCB-E]
MSDQKSTEFTLIEQAMGNPPSWLTHWGITVVALFFCVIFGIAAMIKYPDVLKSEATTYIDHPPIEIFTQTNGRIHTLLVQNKDTIRHNTPILVLESTADWLAVLHLDTLLQTNRSIFDTTFMSKELGDLSSAYHEAALLFKQLEDARQNDITNQRISTLQKEIEQNNILNNSLVAQKEVFAQELKNIKKDLDRSKKLLQDGVISLQEFEQKENTYLQNERTFHQMESSIITNKIKIQQLEIQIPEYKKQQHDFFFRLEVDFQQKKEVLKTAVEHWKKKYILYAPSFGIVSMKHKLQEGNQISPDIPVLTILPNTAQKQAFLKALMDANGIGKVAVGQKATVSFNNYPSAEYGILTAEVVEIAPIPTDNQYEVLLKLPQSWVTNYGVSIPKQQKMNAHIAIQTKEFTLLERIFSGLLDVLKN